MAGLRVQYFTFADDTVLIYNGENIEQLNQLINEDLLLYYKWLLHNKLKINLKKTKYLIFGKGNKISNINIQLNNYAIEQVTSIRFLGLIVDSKMTWKCHIQHICKKINPMIGAIFRFRNCLSDSIKHNL